MHCYTIRLALLSFLVPLVGESSEMRFLSLSTRELSQYFLPILLQTTTTTMIKPDFSKEDLEGTPVEVCPGVYVCGEAHHPAGTQNLNWNNRSFLFRLTLKKNLGGAKAGDEVLFVNGLGKQATIDKVKVLEKEIGLKVVALLCNGGDHHISIKLWYDAFPDLRVWVCPTRVPTTSNGQRLIKEYPDRWELADNTTNPHHVYQLHDYFGDQVDCVLFNQLYCYSDKSGKECGSWCAPEEKGKLYSNTEAFSQLIFGLFTDFSARNDEPVFFHKASGLIITGHHWEFTCAPKGYERPQDQKATGWAFRLMDSMFVVPGRYVSGFAAGTDERIGDPKIHAEQWQEVMKWDFHYGCGHHDVPGVCGPIDSAEIMEGAGGLKGHMKRVLTDSGELTAQAVPGSWWPWKSPNAIWKLTAKEPSFQKSYGPPPVLRLGGPNYDKEGLKKN